MWHLPSFASQSIGFTLSETRALKRTMLFDCYGYVLLIMNIGAPTTAVVLLGNLMDPRLVEYKIVNKPLVEDLGMEGF
uniref:G_PROTEIN_RECEP_F1_2 domain-containing protein n=1 Tax=Steinernema glaseri TaxID=37863 RepID=A0A1I7Y1E4_9BILA